MFGFVAVYLLWAYYQIFQPFEAEYFVVYLNIHPCIVCFRKLQWNHKKKQKYKEKQKLDSKHHECDFVGPLFYHFVVVRFHYDRISWLRWKLCKL
jgi:hypothetical protein